MSSDSDNPFFLFTNCPQPVLIYSTDYLLLDANEAAVQFFQQPKTELVKLTGLDLRAAKDKQEFIAELNERRTVPSRTSRFNTLSGIKIAQTCSYPIVVGGLEARVEIIIVPKADTVPVQWKYLYSRLIKTLEAMPVGFYLLDRNWKVMYWNAQAESIFGINRELVLGKNLWKLFPEAINSKFYDEYIQAMESRVSANFEEYYWPLQKWGKINVQPIDDGLAVFFSDITAYRAAEEALKDNIEQLREVAFMHSHQMRRPVANILGLTQLLDGQNLSGILQELNDLINQSTRELDAMITLSNSRVNSQQDNTRIRTGVDVEAFDFDELAREISYQYSTENPQHSFLANCEANIEFTGNRKAIINLLTILLENSIKFSQDVCRVIVQTEVKHNNLILSVLNFGSVITEARLWEIFLAIQDRQKLRKLGGGLYNATQIISQHSGSMWVESSEVFGTAFYFRFPLPVFCLNQLQENPEPDFIEIEFSTLENRFLYVCWKGIHDKYSVRKGCREIMTAISNKNYEGVIMDTSQVVGHFADSCNLLATNFLPCLEQNAIRKCSWIQPASAFGKLCIQQVIDQTTSSIPVKMFDSKKRAVEWHCSKE
ncbi:MAG TPA: PAS domain-containing sensor histidine kinase [Sphingobacteriaceae bacterium]